MISDVKLPPAEVTQSLNWHWVFGISSVEAHSALLAVTGDSQRQLGRTEGEDHCCQLFPVICSISDMGSTAQDQGETVLLWALLPHLQLQDHLSLQLFPMILRNTGLMTPIYQKYSNNISSL